MLKTLLTLTLISGILAQNNPLDPKDACPDDAVPQWDFVFNVCTCETPQGLMKTPNPGCSLIKKTFFGIPYCEGSCSPQPSGGTRRARSNFRGEMSVMGAKMESLCSAPYSACPIKGDDSGITYMFDCVNTKGDLDNCGGCTTLGKGGKSCLEIPFAKNLACVNGRCQIYSCKRGFRRELDPETKHDRCVPATPPPGDL